MTTISKKRTKVTIEASRQEQVIATLAAAWQEQDFSVRAGWKRLGAQMVSSGPKGKNKPLNPYQAWVMVNGVKLSMNYNIVTEAPAAPVLPAGLPPMTLSATGGSGAANTGFSLLLACPVYPHDVQIFGAAPDIPFDQVSVDNLSLLTSYDSIGGPPYELADWYSAVHGVPPLGSQVALGIVGVSPAGFRGPMQMVKATVGVAAPA